MNIELFAKTAFERHRIYILKKYGVPKPWTTDKIFQNNFFCCTFRKLDKTTEWIIKNVIEPNEDNPDLWKSIIICRYISNINTLKELHERHLLINNNPRLYDYLRQMQKDKKKIFTGAFICNSGIGEGQFVDKVSYLFILLEKLNNTNMELNFILKSTRYSENIFDL